jgi:hypothetical protein
VDIRSLNIVLMTQWAMILMMLTMDMDNVLGDQQQVTEREEHDHTIGARITNI